LVTIATIIAANVLVDYALGNVYFCLENCRCTFYDPVCPVPNSIWL